MYDPRTMATTTRSGGNAVGRLSHLQPPNLNDADRAFAARQLIEQAQAEFDSVIRERNAMRDAANKWQREAECAGLVAHELEGKLRALRPDILRALGLPTRGNAIHPLTNVLMPAVSCALILAGIVVCFL